MNRRRRPSTPTVEPPSVATLFLQEMAYRGSPATARNYRLDIERRFLPYLSDAGVTELAAISRLHCSGFINHEMERGVGRYSLRKSFDVMRRWLTWCVDNGYLEKSPADGMKPPRLGKSMRQGYTRDEVKRLLSTAQEATGFIGRRDYALLLFMVGTGARASEVLALTLDDLEADDYRTHRRLMLHGKGAKDRLVKVGMPLQRALRDWLVVRPKLPTRALWITQRREPMEYSALAAMLTKLGGYAGVSGCIAHRWRHTFASEHYLANRDIMALKSALGHVYIQTTEEYLRALGVDFALSAKYASPDEWLS